jgi:PAS domain S-box-containing protein
MSPGAQQNNPSEQNFSIDEQAQVLKSLSGILPVTVVLIAFPSRHIIYSNHHPALPPGLSIKDNNNLLFPHPDSLQPVDDSTPFDNFYERFHYLKDDEENHAEYKIKDTDGQWRYFSVCGKVYKRNGQHQPVQVLLSSQDITKQRQAELEALRLTEKAEQQRAVKYASIFDSINQGFCIVDVLFNEQQEPVDYRFLETNQAFEKQTLLKNVIGKNMKELRPEHEAFWFNIYGEIARTGKPKSFEHYASQLGDGIWYEVYAFRADPKHKTQVAILFRDISDRKRIEAELQESEEKYRTLFNSMDEGYCIIQMLYDEAGRATDWRFLQTNRAFELNNGLHDAEGKTIKELAPDIEPKWMMIYDGVAQTGTPLRFEEDSVALDRCFSLYAFRIGQAEERKVAVIFTDITKRRQAEQQLRESEEHQMFLLKLSDTLQRLNDAAAIPAEAVEQLRDHFHAGWAYCCEFDETEALVTVLKDAVADGLPSFAGQYAFSDMSALMAIWQSGKPAEIEDLHASTLLDEQAESLHSAVGMQSLLGVPLLKDSKLVAAMIVADKHPRKWTRIAGELVSNAAERVWEAMKRVKAETALRESEALLDGQKEAFQTAMSGQSLAASLQALIRTIYNQTNGEARAAFYMMPQEDGGLHLITGMTEEYARDVNGFPVGPESLACGLAMHTGEAVITPDIEEEPLWEPFRTMARKHHYRGCWSFPIKTTGGPVLGTLAMYFGQPATPTPRELEMAGLLAHSAAIIISRDKEQRERAQAEAALRQAELQYLKRLEEEVRDRTAELQRSRDLLQSVFDTTQIQMSILEVIRSETGEIADLEIKVVNKELEKETGRKDLVGKRYAEEYPGIMQTGLFKLIVKTIETGEPQHTEYFYSHDGFNKWYSCMFVKLGDGVVASNLDISVRRETEIRLKQLERLQHQKIVKATFSALEEERNRISESLHNGLGQVLYGVKLSLSNLTPERALNDPDGFREDHQYTDKLLAQSIQEARRISHELMPATLNDHGLKVAIQDICNQFREGLTINCRIKGSAKGLDKYLELAVYRTVQELVVNIVKHAAATKGTIAIDIDSGMIHIAVKDNGQGIRHDGRDHAAGIGLSSIRAKIGLLNGTMKIVSTPGKGTGVYIDIPYIKKQNRNNRP